MAVNLGEQEQKNLTTAIQNALTDTSKKLESSGSYTSSIKQHCALTCVDCEVKGTVEYNNIVNSALHIMQNDSANLSTEAQSSVKSAIKNELEASIKQGNKGLSFGQVNMADVYQEINNYIDTNMKSIIDNSVSGFISIDNEVDQSCKLDFSGSKIYGKLEVTNEVVLNVTASMITDSIIRDISNLSSDVDVENAMTAKLIQLNKGLDPVGAIMAVIGGMILGAISAKIAN